MYRIFTCMVAVFAAVPMVAATAALENRQLRSDDGNLSLTMSVTERAEYGFDPGRLANWSVGYGKALHESLRLFLSQGLNYRSYPYEEIRGSDTSLMLNLLDLLDLGESLSLGARLSATIGHSKASTDAQKKGQGSARLGLDYKLNPYLILGIWAGGSTYIYDRTISEDGVANPRYSQFAGLQIAGSFARMSSGFSFSLLEIVPFENWQREYAFNANAWLSYQWFDDLVLSAGVDSSNDQLRKGRNLSFRPFDPEVSSYYIAISKTLNRIGI